MERRSPPSPLEMDPGHAVRSPKTSAHRPASSCLSDSFRSELGVPMDLQLNGLRVVVTAGANGIGRDVAKSFAGEGARVHICDVDEEALQRLTSGPDNITGTVCDVSDRGAVQQLVKDAFAALGGLDCLVNNAGIAGPTGRVDQIDPEAWDRTIARQPYRPVDLRASGGSSPAQEHQCQYRQHFLGGWKIRVSDIARPMPPRNGLSSGSPNHSPWNWAGWGSG